MASKKYECDRCGRTFNTLEGCEVHEEHCKIQSHKVEKKEMDMGWFIIYCILALGIIFIWGVIGHNIVLDIGKTCDFGFRDGSLCWVWHTNEAGKLAEGINNLFGQ